MMRFIAAGKHRHFKGGELVVTAVDMTIEIDQQALANYFAGKLRRSKRGVSKLQNGAIKATRIAQKDFPA